MDANEQAELARYREEAAEATIQASVATGLAGRQLTPGAAEQITTLLKSSIQVVTGPDGKRMAVGPGGMSAREYVSAQLQKPEYAKFISGGSSGGGSKGGYASMPVGGYPPGPAPDDQRPTTLAQAIKMHIAEQVREGGDGRTNPRLPMPWRPVGG
jgi:hypothetical protein